MKADRNHLWALAIFFAIHGDNTLMLKFEQELIELWNGDGI